MRGWTLVLLMEHIESVQDSNLQNNKVPKAAKIMIPEDVHGTQLMHSIGKKW